MTIHIIKLSVGSESIEGLAEWQATRMEQRRRAREPIETWHRTRMFPRRKSEVLDGGSIYWVIRGLVLVRQRIIDLRAVIGEDGISRCDIVYDPKLVPVRPVPRRPFQGWRYLAPADAPPDLSALGGGLDDIPAKMRAELAELGLI